MYLRCLQAYACVLKEGVLRVVNGNTLADFTRGLANEFIPMIPLLDQLLSPFQRWENRVSCLRTWLGVSPRKRVKVLLWVLYLSQVLTIFFQQQ